jgi:LPXTG-motif cell wall-anchored protein
VTGKTVFTFTERAAGEPQAIRAWFYPGDNFGQEFVYRKSRAAELAKQTDSSQAKPLNEEPVVATEQSQDTADKPAEKEVDTPQAVEPPPAQTTPAQPEATPDAPDSMEQLPQTASQLPFWGLIGLVSLGAGLALMGFLKRRNLTK